MWQSPSVAQQIYEASHFAAINEFETATEVYSLCLGGGVTVKFGISMDTFCY